MSAVDKAYRRLRRQLGTDAVLCMWLDGSRLRGSVEGVNQRKMVVLEGLAVVVGRAYQRRSDAAFMATLGHLLGLDDASDGCGWAG